MIVMIGFLLIMIVMHFLTDGGRVGDVLHLGPRGLPVSDDLSDHALLN